MENLSTLNNFFDGRDESWFYLITVEIEARGAASVVPLMLSIDAIQRYNEEKELATLRTIRLKTRTESNISFLSDNTHESNDVDSIDYRNVRNGREDSNWNIDDCLQRKLLRSSNNNLNGKEDEDEEDEGDIRDEEALMGELTVMNVSVYVSLQLRKIATSIKVCNNDDCFLASYYYFFVIILKDTLLAVTINILRMLIIIFIIISTIIIIIIFFFY